MYSLSVLYQAQSDVGEVILDSIQLRVQCKQHGKSSVKLF